MIWSGRIAMVGEVIGLGFTTCVPPSVFRRFKGRVDVSKVLEESPVIFRRGSGRSGQKNRLCPRCPQPSQQSRGSEHGVGRCHLSQLWHNMRNWKSRPSDLSERAWHEMAYSVVLVDFVDAQRTKVILMTIATAYIAVLERLATCSWLAAKMTVAAIMAEVGHFV